MNDKPQVLLIDLENSPILGWTWGMYDENVLSVERDWHLMCAAWQWYPKHTVHVRALPDYANYKDRPHDDYELCEELWNLLDRADVVVGHNSQAFDVKKAQARFFAHGMPPPSPFQHFDTLRACRKHFRLGSNKLGAVAEISGATSKGDAGGISTWLDCIAGDAKAWSRMRKYNRQDVVVLREVYDNVKAWGAPNSPNMGLWSDGDRPVCPRCAHTPMHGHGWRYTTVNKYRRYKCPKCGAYARGRTSEGAKPMVV